MKPIHILVFIGVIAVVVSGVFIVTLNKAPNNEQVFCTADALLCPDGSYVGRTGRECQFSACPNAETAADTTVGEIGVKETKMINGVRIAVNSVTEDSRCPSDATCIWAGRLTANVSLKSNINSETRTIFSDTPVEFDTHTISLVSATPPPKSTEKKDFSQYRLTFKVVPTSGN
ncbi:MAG: hypothetical protein AAB691_01995 [Patescibacteria group bacterium]